MLSIGRRSCSYFGRRGPRSACSACLLTLYCTHLKGHVFKRVPVIRMTIEDISTVYVFDYVLLERRFFIYLLRSAAVTFICGILTRYIYKLRHDQVSMSQPNYFHAPCQLISKVPFYYYARLVNDHWSTFTSHDFVKIPSSDERVFP
jgi:hypothetical protein